MDQVWARFHGNLHFRLVNHGFGLNLNRVLECWEIHQVHLEPGLEMCGGHRTLVADVAATWLAKLITETRKSSILREMR